MGKLADLAIVAEDLIDKAKERVDVARSNASQAVSNVQGVAKGLAKDVKDAVEQTSFDLALERVAREYGISMDVAKARLNPPPRRVKKPTL